MSETTTATEPTPAEEPVTDSVTAPPSALAEWVGVLHERIVELERACGIRRA